MNRKNTPLNLSLKFLDYEDSKEVLRKHSFQLTSNLIEKTPTFSFGFSKNIIEKENFEKKSLEMCESQSSTKNKTENTSEIKESDSNTKLNENIKKNKSSIFQQISDFFSELVFSNETKERRDSIVKIIMILIIFLVFTGVSCKRTRRGSDEIIRLLKIFTIFVYFKICNNII